MQANRILTGFIIAVLILAGGQWSQATTAPHQPYVDGEVLVRYRENRAPQRTVHYRSMWRLSNVRTFEKTGIRKVRLPADMTVSQAVALYRSDPDVLYAEPNYRYRLQAVPNDTDMTNLWGLVNTGQRVNDTTGTADADIDANRAWDLETGGTDVLVAVVDSGVDVTHPDLSANIWNNPNEINNGIDDDGNGYIDDIHGWDFVENDNQPIDSHGHGTHVAGIIGAVGNNGMGSAGVCWRVSLMPLRFITASDYGTTADAIEAIEYADDNGADVINLSWGGPDYSQALKDAIDAVDALVVCAVGNEGVNLDDVPLYPASYDSANLLSVAASDADDYPAWFTNYSDSLADVAAPGTLIYSTVPDRQTLLVDDFSGLSNWTVGGDGNAWDLQSIYGNKVLAESPAGNYTNGMDAWARLDPLNLSGLNGTRLDFTIIGNTAGNGDRLIVEASTDGTAWTRLWVGLDDGPVQAISGTINTWQLAIADLKAFDGAASLAIRFRFVSDASGTAGGYLIDSLAVTCADTTHGTTAYQYYQGTSMSAAYASGAAALIMAQKPLLTHTEVKLAIESTVDEKASLAGVVATGGRVNVYNALVSMAAVDLQSRATSTDRIDLGWTALEPVDSGFEIQRRAASGNDYTTIAIVGIQERQYADNGLSDGTTYVYRVLTLSGGDRTGYSNEAVATTPRSVSAGVATASGGGGGGGCFISAAGSGRHLLDPTNHAAVRLGAAIILLVCGFRALRSRNRRHRTMVRQTRSKRTTINRIAA
jgi:subtilisin family serine protease